MEYLPKTSTKRPVGVQDKKSVRDDGTEWRSGGVIQKKGNRAIQYGSHISGNWTSCPITDPLHGYSPCRKQCVYNLQGGGALGL
jgi:hypothetical protein